MPIAQKVSSQRVESKVVSTSKLLDTGKSLLNEDLTFVVYNAVLLVPHEIAESSLIEVSQFMNRAIEHDFLSFGMDGPLPFDVVDERLLTEKYERRTKNK